MYPLALGRLGVELQVQVSAATGLLQRGTALELIFDEQSLLQSVRCGHP
jgi:hypothetical protein